ncbi:MAG: DUF1501 domain-containing protein [Pedosphaera sp.]|nr:DUF1501 domain-containing protein [Pedosphaera sp.]MSU42830.1 DUF1501 domain-containing protein [Pedosphaera sp.]
MNLSTLTDAHGYSSRRDFLQRAGTGFGALALNGMLDAAAPSPVAAADPLAAKRPHFAGTAKRCIFLFMEGGPSHIDLFDPKPLLNRLAGQRLPASFKRPITAMGEAESPLLASPRKWRQHGQGGLWISDWLPHTAQCADDIAVIRSCWTNGINHSGGVCQMNTGKPSAGRPCLGSWAVYGLGTENQNLPAFVVMTDTNATPVNGPRNWSAGFMPAVYQGVHLHPGDDPIRHLALPAGADAARHARKLQLLAQINREHASTRPQQSELEARIRSYELAYSMQATAPEAVDLSRESKATQQLYGMDQPETEAFGRNCLLARRLVERGVRFVQLYHGAGSKWDSHSKMEGNHGRQCRQSDKPIAGLLRDLKARGLLDDTLVVWGGEFGRTPMSEKGDGRDHNPTGFTMWMAGGGVKGGRTIGSTDELGLYAVNERLHVHDLHATILHLMGIGNLDLIYRYKGRPETPTINEGEAYTRITSAV